MELGGNTAEHFHLQAEGARNSYRRFYLHFTKSRLQILHGSGIIDFVLGRPRIDSKELPKESICAAYWRGKEEEKIMKRTMAALLLTAMAAVSAAGCADSGSAASSQEGTAEAPTVEVPEEAPEKEADPEVGSMEGTITVVSREDGSGTRGAFIELFGIEQKDADGNKIDHTTEAAEITNSTSVMMTTIAGNESAIGYVSLGSLSDEVKALEIDGAKATAENVKSGTYKVARPFNVATLGDAEGLSKDFLDFVLSEEGQTVVEENGYVSQGNNGKFEGTLPEGKITVGGSSSVTPVMEKLKEAYTALNPNAAIEVQQSDSTTGMTSTIDGTYDIGMASRELKDTELEGGLVPMVIAMDGIAVVVNNNNPISEMASEDVMRIYTGEVGDWSELPQ